MKSLTTLAGAAVLLAAGGAQAQDVPTTPPAEVPEPVQTAPIPPSDPAINQEAARAFSDDEISAFAAAAVRMRDLREDDTLDDAAREMQAQAIVAEAGLDEETYREIGRAAQADPAVAMRVQEAINAMEGDEPDAMADEMQEEEPGA